MAIEALYLHYLKQALDRPSTVAGPRSALLLAYPDLLVPRGALVQLFGEPFVAALPARADAAEAWRYHGLAGVTEPMYDSVALFRALGLEPTVIDAAALRGMERVVDLNHPLPPDLENRFDLVVDTGTCEHCFNVAQAFANACAALREGGLLVHAAPLTRVNHGFWSFNPTVYPDFFEANGFALHLLTGVEGSITKGFTPFPVQAFARFQPPPEAALYVVAERREVRALRWPVQRKYQGMLPPGT